VRNGISTLLRIEFTILGLVVYRDYRIRTSRISTLRRSIDFAADIDFATEYRLCNGVSTLRRSIDFVTEYRLCNGVSTL
jgi:hypothetical protein